jgi:trans-aconitate 3-methyltransferase
MSQSTPDPAPFPKEKTFSSYNHEQGKAYAENRRDYHSSVYQAIINHHTSTGGQLDTLLDIGCGPGTATQTLASHFAHVIGLDPSEGMISTARSLGGVTSTSEPIRYEISTAEELGKNLSPPIQDSSIDLITAANAAHWFDMSGFWPSAARVLKPGGSVALWTGGEGYIHPSMPNAAGIQAAMDKFLDQHLKPYYEPGNLLTRNRYVDLKLPWTLAQPIPELDKSTFFRKDWEIGEQFYVGEPEVDMDTMERVLATGSAVTRWRQAHPEDVGTERDVLRILRREIERLLHEAGVEKGKEKVKGAMRGVLLIVKKKM